MPERRVSLLTDGKDPEQKAALVAACILEVGCAGEVRLLAILQFFLSAS